ncbi:kinesin-like protein costa [Venturia canescens]|uniref:kinesin-like protein costa n=1 Tax=Venturia canescens TaxID=32260 RepID=UPI001C9C2DE5|nr:kinesin-like protein costa [Venturia canescens]XP_043288713.1 kinesin-like protein costa [Venturia canescens]
MMHYGSWLQQGAMLDNQRYYNRYMDERTLYETRGDVPEEVDSEQTGDETQETMTSATSCERSTSADIFRLEFAAAQWSKLVSNAEGLFNKLMVNNVLPDCEQDQIEEWLCLKQEYEECIGSDETVSLQGYQETARRSLEIIEEVTETDEKTDESRNGGGKFGREASGDSPESEISEEDDLEEDLEEEEEEKSDAENSDFQEKLDELMNRFKLETDELINAQSYEFEASQMAEPKIMTEFNSNLNNNNDYVPIVKPIPIRNPNTRRNSMLPGSEMCNEVMTFNSGFRPCRNRNDLEINHEILREARAALEVVPEPIKTLKTLTANNEAKQSLVNKIQTDLEIAQRQIIELQATIRSKERLIEDMNKNSDVRSCVKEKFQRKRSKLQEEYFNTRSQLAQAENSSAYEDGEQSEAGRREVQRYKAMAINYEKRLVDIEMMRQIAGDSAKKVLELESSLNSSKKQMEKLKRQLKKEEDRKRQLEHELSEDQKRIRELEEKYNLTASKLREIQQSESEDERHSAFKLDDPKTSERKLDEPRNADAKPEDERNLSARLEDVNCDEKKNLLEVSARISHLDQVLKEKSMNLERMTDTDEREALRHEIRNLRRTRECLIEEKCGLDEKLQKERTLSTLEERKLLECGETIEAIDAMIEHKNEMICGRKNLDVKQAQRENSERMLSQLEKLSDSEMRTLFDKYFWKVIDLKQSSKNLEIQSAELERHVELQDKRIRSLTEALQCIKIEAERRLVELQHKHEEHLHHIFRHMTDENSAGTGYDLIDRNLELARFKRENKTLRRRLAEFEALLKLPHPNNPTTTRKNFTSPPRIVPQELRKIAPKTKVTREGNKLIIQKE